MISAGPLVDWSVILYGSKLSVLLFDEEEVGGIGTPGFSYRASFQVFLDEVMDLLDFFLVER